MRTRFAAPISAAAFIACGGLPTQYAVRPAISPSAAPLRVLVTDQLELPKDWSDDASLTLEAKKLPGALRKSLLEAGYEVITEASQPHDLASSLSVDVTLRGYESCWGIAGRTTLVLRSADRIVDQIEIELPEFGVPPAQQPKAQAPTFRVPLYAQALGLTVEGGDAQPEGKVPICVRAEDYAVIASAKLANAVTASPRVTAFAKTANKPVDPVIAMNQKPRPSSGRNVVVAVFNVEDGSRQLDARVADQLTDYLSTKLAEVMRYRVVPRDQIRARLGQEKGDSYKACYEESCQIDLGKALAAEKSLATKLLRVGNSCALTSTLYDLKTETVDQAASARTECSDNALMNGVDTVVQQLQSNANR
jgi:hypothetical protein